MEPAFTNNLIHETSPYLLQHAHNPVHWNAWHQEVWQRAKQEDKMVIVSIGYSACHWCHVMEHESFEDTTVAKIMNDHFICIKVDREERPDVDQIYMDACQLISGSGGWPLNAFALPDGRPIYAGTYFPKENWKQVLLYFVDYWKNHREEALERATEITKGIKGMDLVPKAGKVADFTKADRNKMFEKLDANWDDKKGGRRGAPKFPMPVNMQYLLRNYYYTGNEKALKDVTVTLDNMMNGGIYDQIGGGFARYSVDSNWTIPHFEKMLYDNAQLVSLYSEAYQLTDNERYREVVEESLKFVERELSDTSGGFYSALDADSEGEEGKYYVWSYAELKKILGSDFEAFRKVYGVSEQGNFEGKNNLLRYQEARADTEQLAKWKQLLMTARSKRAKPGLDDKVLTSWNALMLKGYADAYRALGEVKYLKRALQCATFLKERMIQPDYSIQRNYKNGKTSINGFLDDYSFTCEALITLYQVTFDEQWLSLSKHLADYAIQHFYNANSQLFFYTDISDAPLITRKTETSDNVIPSSNSAMAKVLYQLGLYYDQSDYLKMAKNAAHQVKANTLEYTAYYGHWAMLSDWLMKEPYEVVIAGKEALSIQQQFGKYFLPDCVFAGARESSSLPLLQDRIKPNATYIYVCRNKVCQLPVLSVSEALKDIKEK